MKAIQICYNEYRRKAKEKSALLKNVKRIAWNQKISTLHPEIKHKIQTNILDNISIAVSPTEVDILNCIENPNY